MNCRGMVDCTSHMKVAGWPGNTEVSINPVTVSVSYKQKYMLTYTCHKLFLIWSSLLDGVMKFTTIYYYVAKQTIELCKIASLYRYTRLYILYVYGPKSAVRQCLS